MRQVALQDLKDQLDEHLAAARAGEIVLVAAQGEAVAQIGPAPAAGRAASDHSAADVIADLVRRGLAPPAKHAFRPLPNDEPIMTLAELLADLDEARADR